MVVKSKFRKAIGELKDQTSRSSVAKVVAGIFKLDLDFLIQKVINHDDEPADERTIMEILDLLSDSRKYVSTCVNVISKRLGKTRNWVVALKCFVLLHRLLSYDDDPAAFNQEVLRQTIQQFKSVFEDRRHSNSLDYSYFVKSYADFLLRKLQFRAYQGEYDLEKLNELFELFVAFVSCKPIGEAKNNKMVVVALRFLVKDSCRLYSEINHVLLNLSDTFVDKLELTEKLVQINNLCKGIEFMHSVEFPDVKIVSDKLLATLQAMLWKKEPESLDRSKELIENSNDHVILDDEQGNKTASTLFSVNYDWETFSEDKELDVTLSSSAVKSDWELALMESAKNLSKSNLFVANDWELSIVESVSNLSMQNPFVEELAIVESSTNSSEQKADLNLNGSEVGEEAPFPVDHSDI